MVENVTRVAVVTGGTSGIGLATARALHEKGYTVVIGARNITRLEAVSRELGVLAYELDVTDEQSVRAFFDRVRAVGSIDLLINNAGVGYAKTVSDFDISDARNVMSVNFFGPLLCCKHALPNLRQPGSRVINISSTTAFRAGAGTSIYSASKAALNRAADSLRVEFAEFGIDVIQVNPGYARETNFHSSLPSPAHEENSVNKVVSEILKATVSRRAYRFMSLRQACIAVGSLLVPRLMDVLQTRFGNHV